MKLIKLERAHVLQECVLDITDEDIIKMRQDFEHWFGKPIAAMVSMPMVCDILSHKGNYDEYFRVDCVEEYDGGEVVTPLTEAVENWFKDLCESCAGECHELEYDIYGSSWFVQEGDGAYEPIG